MNHYLVTIKFQTGEHYEEEIQAASDRDAIIETLTTMDDENIDLIDFNIKTITVGRIK